MAVRTPSQLLKADVEGMQVDEGDSRFLASARRKARATDVDQEMRNREQEPSSSSLLIPLHPP